MRKNNFANPYWADRITFNGDPLINEEAFFNREVRQFSSYPGLSYEEEEDETPDYSNLSRAEY